jgi:transketolase
MINISLSEIATSIRRDIIWMAYRSGGPHVGSALSCTDILATLYNGALRLDPWLERDIFILSKAHASMALYATLAANGFLPRERLESYCQYGGLPAHLDWETGCGVECSAGSLGHGFNIGLGMAYGFKSANSRRQVYVLLGDGETQEGSIWEGAMFAPALGLDNFTAIIDYNNLQGYGRPREICNFEPVAEKWTAFGWNVSTVDGHDHCALHSAFHCKPDGRPRLIISRTVKGKGVSFMENELIWHYYIVTEEIRDKALSELR